LTALTAKKPRFDAPLKYLDHRALAIIRIGERKESPTMAEAPNRAKFLVIVELDGRPAVLGVTQTFDQLFVETMRDLDRELSWRKAGHRNLVPVPKAPRMTLGLRWERPLYLFSA